MTTTTKTETTKAERPPDPALVTAKKAAEAAAAFNAFAGDETSPEWVAVEKRTTEADAAFADAPVTSAAGALAKLAELRAMVSPPEHDPDETSLVTRHFKTVTAFLQAFTGTASVIADDPAVVAFPAPAPKLDPVVTLFAEWGAIQDEATALIAANPEAKSGELNDRWEAALDRRDVVGDKIMSTPATSIKGVAVKVRLASHYAFDIVELAPLHDTPSRDIDYSGEHGAGGALNDYLVSALRDAERLAGVS